MAQNNTYRQQTSIGLGGETACPQCGTNPPAFFSYKVDMCNNAGQFYVSQSDAFFGSNQVINSNTYSIGQVVWVTAGAASPRLCAEIIDINVDEEPGLYIDIQGGPWSQCNQCIDSNQNP